MKDIEEEVKLENETRKEGLALDFFAKANKHEIRFDLGWIKIFKAGYNKSQETHPFTEKDMIDFVVWYETSEFTYRYWKNKNIYPRMDGSHNEDYREGIQELLMVWKQIQEDPFKFQI